MRDLTETELLTSSPHPTDLRVGSRIREQRRLLGLSQGDLARRLGITFQQVQKYERGANRVSASRLEHCSQILCQPIAWFFETDQAETSQIDAKISQLRAALLLLPDAIIDVVVSGFLSTANTIRAIDLAREQGLGGYVSVDEAARMSHGDAREVVR